MQLESKKLLEDIRQAASHILIHGYDVVEDAVVWDVVTQDLPALYKQVRFLLGK